VTDYWQYKAVHHWMSRIAKRQTYCLASTFFGVVSVILSREEIFSRIWDSVDANVLHALQTRTEPYLKRLNLAGPAEDVLLVLWNHAPTRETIRGLLVAAARDWLVRVEKEGIGGFPAKPLTDEEEIRYLESHGFLAMMDMG